MNQFELNILNYTKKELEEIFELQPDYQLQDVKNMEARLVKSIENGTDVTNDLKTKTVQFIQEVSRELGYDAKPDMRVAEMQSQPEKVPAAIYHSNHPAAYLSNHANPVKRHDRNIVLNIDSRFRENYFISQPSNFQVTLPMKINSVDTMKMSAIEFPPTAFFSISKVLGNNFFWVRAGSEAGSDLEETVVILPDGNYSPTETMSLINNFLQSLATTTYLQYIYFSVNQNATNTSGSSQLLVGVAEAYPFTIPFNFELDFQADQGGAPDDSTPLPLKLGWKLGFRDGRYVNSSAYVSEGIVNLSGATYLYLAIDDYNNFHNTFYSAFNQSLLNKNILARIAVQSSQGNAVTFSNIGIVSTAREYYGPVNIERMQIQLLDEYGRIVNLNNMDFSFCLSFTTAKENSE